MNGLVRGAVDGFSSGGVKEALRNTRNHLLGWGVVVSALLFALFFLSVMGFFILSHYVSPMIAAGVLCACWFLVSGIAWLSRKQQSTKPEESRKPMRITDQVRNISSKLSDQQKDMLKTAAMTILPFVAKKKFLLRLGLPGLLLAGLYMLKTGSRNKETE